MTKPVNATQTAYYQATRSPQPSNKYPQTLAACALAPCDEFGQFGQRDVTPILSKIIGEQRETGSFADRLNKLTEEDRGRVLVTFGKKLDKRFRFRDPLLQPFVVMKGISESMFSIGDAVGDDKAT